MRRLGIGSAAVLTLVLVSAAAASKSGGWSRQHTPDPASHGNAFYAVSCTNTCTAVGASMRSSSNAVTLAAHWNGKRWTLQRTPNRAGAKDADLTGVSCAFPKACFAVGYSGNGGTRKDALVERFNGKKWVVARSAHTGAANSYLAGISCTSPHACIAVGAAAKKGGRYVPLAEHWNGKRWSARRPPPSKGARQSSLVSVWCSFPSVCTAVGFYQTAGGGLHPFAERWNGRKWSNQRPPTPSGARGGALQGVVCPSGGTCVAVGYFRNSSGADIAFAEHGNGKKWSLQRLPSPSGAQGSELDAVSCTSNDGCTAVGYYERASSAEVTLAERWNGKGWFVQPTPKPGSSVQSYLSGVSCRSSSECTAAGYYDNAAQREITLAEHWRG